MNIRFRMAGMYLGWGLALAVTSPAHADPSILVQQEINYLIGYIADSGCAFQRNGTWNDSKAAAAHVRKKYDFLAKRGHIKTTEDFVDKAATESSFSGKPYEIKCGDATAIPSGLWLSQELARYRASQLTLQSLPSLPSLQ